MGFRFFAERAARNLGVGGYVRNLYDGRVEIYVVGAAGQIAAMKQELQRGPRMARVDHVGEEGAEVLRTYENEFSIENDQ